MLRGSRFLIVNGINGTSAAIEHEVEVFTFTTLSTFLSHFLCNLKFIQT